MNTHLSKILRALSFPLFCALSFFLLLTSIFYIPTYIHAATTISTSPSAPGIATTTCSSGLTCGLVGYWTFDGKDTGKNRGSASIYGKILL
jgi:hypothetical protein